jgi:uncharacterized membrane protein (UPF0182 family)
MITNANDFISVDRINQRLTPYNTGKVQIGLLYQLPPPEMTQSEELIQAALMGWSSIHRPVPLWPVTLGSVIVGILIILTVG